MKVLIASNHDAVREKSKKFNKVSTVGASGTDLSPQHAVDDALLVRGKSDVPIVNRHGFGQSILGSVDRRTDIQNPSAYPWRMICSLEITAADGEKYLGTGWLVGPRLVVTAGHCVFDKIDMKGWAASIKVYPGRSEDTDSENCYLSTELRAPQQWVSNEDENFDYGAILLKDDIGSANGYFSMGSYPDEILTNHMVNISGYPYSRAGVTQLHHSNRILKTSAAKIYYDVDTEGGQSGSPVWIYEEGSVTPTVIGIHSYGTGKATLGNSGVRVTSEVVDFFNGIN